MDRVELVGCGEERKRRHERDAQHCKKRKGEAEEDRDAADARRRQRVHTPVVTVGVDDSKPHRKTHDQRRRQRADGGGDDESRSVDNTWAHRMRAHPRAPSSVAYPTSATPASASNWLATASG